MVDVRICRSSIYRLRRIGCCTRWVTNPPPAPFHLPPPPAPSPPQPSHHPPTYGETSCQLTLTNNPADQSVSKCTQWRPRYKPGIVVVHPLPPSYPWSSSLPPCFWRSSVCVDRGGELYIYIYIRSIVPLVKTTDLRPVSRLRAWKGEQATTTRSMNNNNNDTRS